MKSRYFVLLAIAVICASLPATAQKFLPKAIQFIGAPDFTDAELLDAAGLKTGTVLSQSEMQEHSKKLMDTGVFESLAFKFDGLNLVYTLVESSTMFPIRLENLPLPPDLDVNAKLHEQFALFHGRVPSDGGLLESVRGALTEMLAANGMKATVESSPYSDAKLHKVVAMGFAVTAPKVNVGAIHLEGVSPDLEKRVAHIAEHAAENPYDLETAKNLEEAVTLDYVDEGYAAVKVQVEEVFPVMASADAIAVPFKVKVEEGRVYRLGTIHLPADALITPAEIEKGFQTRVELNQGREVAGTIQKGQTPRNTWALIKSKYKSKGYLDSVVTPRPAFDEATGTVSYTVEITPGPVYHLAFVKFENLSDELRRRLMREWQMLPGDVFDENYVSSFVINAEKEDPGLLQALMGRKVSYNVIANPETHEVNCVIHFAQIHFAQQP